MPPPPRRRACLRVSKSVQKRRRANIPSQRHTQRLLSACSQRLLAQPLPLPLSDAVTVVLQSLRARYVVEPPSYLVRREGHTPDAHRPEKACVASCGATKAALSACWRADGGGDGAVSLHVVVIATWLGLGC